MNSNEIITHITCKTCPTLNSSTRMSGKHAQDTRYDYPLRPEKACALCYEHDRCDTREAREGREAEGRMKTFIFQVSLDAARC